MLTTWTTLLHTNSSEYSGIHNTQNETWFDEKWSAMHILSQKWSQLGLGVL